MVVRTRDSGRADRLSDLLEGIGSVLAERIILDPPPGTATEADLRRLGSSGKLCELVDGVLVEKSMGWYESVLAATLIRLLGGFVTAHNLGLVSGPDGTVRLAPGLIRAPDVAFVSWDRLPATGPRRDDPAPSLAPDLAVEILCEKNTQGEMRRKVRDYFAAGTTLVWILGPAARAVQVFTGSGESTMLSDDDFLTAYDLLPGFHLQVREWLDAAKPPDRP